MRTKNIRKGSRTVVFLIRYYEGNGTKVVEKRITGVTVNLSEHQENPMFFVTDEFNQDAFCIPYHRLVEVIQLGTEVRPRKPRPTKSPAAVVPLKARA